MTAEHPIVAFLKARYDDREAQARSDIDHFDDPGAANPEPRGQWIVRVAREVLRDIEANRRILDELVPEIESMDGAIEGEWGHHAPVADQLLEVLALPYSDHPEYAALHI